MHIRLLSGALETLGESETQGATQLDRRCMLVYAGKFESMDGPVEITDEHIDRLAAAVNDKMKLKGGKVKMKDLPPIQLDHSTSAKDTIGRLMGPLEVGEYTREDGSTVKALFGTARILGKDNVERVQDGRWTHLSIGADLEQGKMTELTVTPFPAAPDASMLSVASVGLADGYIDKSFDWSSRALLPGGIQVAYAYGPEGKRVAVFDRSVNEYRVFKTEAAAVEWAKKNETKLSSEQPAPSTKGDPMKTGFKKHLAEALKMADEDVEKKHAEMKKHLVECKSMKDEDAEKHLEAADDAECKKLMDEKADHEKKLAEKIVADAKEASDAQAKMSAALSGVKKLSSDMRASMESARLAARCADVRSKLSKFKAEAKVTPAEIKALDIVKLAKLSPDALEVVMDTYKARQPVLLAGMIGDTRAQDVVKAAKAHAEKVRLAKLELEMRKNMGASVPSELTKLAEGQPMPEEVSVHIDATPHTHYDMGADWDHMKKLLADGKDEEAKAHLKKIATAMKGLVDGEAMEAPEVATMTEEVAKMSAQIEELTKLTAQLAGEQ